MISLNPKLGFVQICPLVNRYCFLFAAHHHTDTFWLKLIDLMATHSCYKYRRLFTSSFRILTRNSHFQTTTIRFPNENSSVTLNRYYRHQYKRQIRYVHAFHAPTQTMHVSSMQQQKYVVVRERSLSHFKEEWIRILRECEVAEPFWSVKWIVEHVLRKHPHSEVC